MTDLSDRLDRIDVKLDVMDYRSFIISKKHLYPTSLIINRCRIHRQNWQRDFESWHQYCWTLCDESFDRSALEVVGVS